jgi:cytochrome c oxidase cbb3-type subunit 3
MNTFASSDFTSGFWSIYISVITIVAIAWTLYFLKSQTTRKLAPGEQAEEMGHAWDGDLRELNNPLPRWWVGLFYLTIVFSVIYLILYPGLGTFKGVLGWTSLSSHQDEIKAAEAKFAPQYARFTGMDLQAVAADPQAKEMGQRLFLTYCMQCHGSDAAGATHFPNLTDGDWLYGGDPDTVKASIVQGRAGVMPGFGPALGADGVKQVANYVLSLSGRDHDAGLASAGAEKFAANCAGCHMPDGAGMAALGAPNLKDKTWLHGATEAAIEKNIANGFNSGPGAFPSSMPSGDGILGTTSNKEAKIHLLAAYVWGLGGGQMPAAPAMPEPAADIPEGVAPGAESAEPAPEAAAGAAQ